MAGADMKRSTNFGALLGLVALCHAGEARAERYGIFSVDPSDPTTIMMDGPISSRSPLNFRRARRDHPGATLFRLNSPGGAVPAALLIAKEVREHGLASLVPPEAHCMSACSFVFLAGSPRNALGVLGVHQMYSNDGTQYDIQLSLSDVIEILKPFNVDMEIIVRMLRTTAEDIYIFSEEEKRRLSLLTPLEPPSELPAIAGAGVSPGESPVALLYEEGAGTGAKGSVLSGDVKWEAVKVPTAGRDSEWIVRANVSIAERSFTVNLVFQENQDGALPASHVIEIAFQISSDFPGGGISEVPGLIMKETEDARGSALRGDSNETVSGSPGAGHFSETAWSDIIGTHVGGHLGIVGQWLSSSAGKSTGRVSSPARPRLPP